MLRHVGDIAASRALQVARKGSVAGQKERLLFTHRSTLWDLEYWKDLDLRHNLDVMHIEKNICDNIISTLLNIEAR